MNHIAIKTRAATSLTDVVAHHLTPLVERIDREGLYPEDTLAEIGATGSFAHHLDGNGAGLSMAIGDMAEVGETCLTTAFCMWCQNALVWYLARSENTELADRLLPDLTTGARLGGTGLSNPMKSFSGIERLALRGKRVAGGYRVSGRLPWVSNLGEGHSFAGIFALPDDRRVMSVFTPSLHPDAPVKLARNTRFIALEGTGTYTILIKDAFIPDEDVIAEDATEFLPRIRLGFVLLQFGMGLGLSRGVADLMQRHGASREKAAWLPLGPDEISSRADALQERARRLAETHADPSRAAFLTALEARLDLSWLTLDAARTGALQLGAAGYVEGSEISRRQREAQFVAIVSPSIKHITTELARGP